MPRPSSRCPDNSYSRCLEPVPVGNNLRKGRSLATLQCMSYDEDDTAADTICSSLGNLSDRPMVPPRRHKPTRSSPLSSFMEDSVKKKYRYLAEEREDSARRGLFRSYVPRDPAESISGPVFSKSIDNELNLRSPCSPSGSLPEPELPPDRLDSGSDRLSSDTDCRSSTDHSRHVNNYGRNKSHKIGISSGSRNLSSGYSKSRVDRPPTSSSEEDTYLDPTNNRNDELMINGKCQIFIGSDNDDSGTASLTSVEEKSRSTCPHSHHVNRYSTLPQSTPFFNTAPRQQDHFVKDVCEDQKRQSWPHNLTTRKPTELCRSFSVDAVVREVTHTHTHTHC